mmetsp:Transcript_15191/g.25716  ORF Transcript_15191/g.25716 Transcript_15191/m.25716 type:complete len:113 (-) Transcript_15191:44-382(-)
MDLQPNKPESPAHQPTKSQEERVAEVQANVQAMQNQNKEYYRGESFNERSKVELQQKVGHNELRSQIYQNQAVESQIYTDPDSNDELAGNLNSFIMMSKIDEGEDESDNSSW